MLLILTTNSWLRESNHFLFENQRKVNAIHLYCVNFDFVELIQVRGQFSRVEAQLKQAERNLHSPRAFFIETVAIYKSKDRQQVAQILEENSNLREQVE